MGARVRRREFIGLLGGATALAAPRWASAQSTPRRLRLGWLNATDTFKEPQNVAFVQRLGELGFVEGVSLMIERRHADSKIEHLPASAAELAKLKCDVLFGSGLEASLAALTQADRDTPIVFVAVDFDPLATGDIASLARPGGRVTGVTALQSELPAKRLELLKEMLPSVSSVAVFTNEQTSEQLSLVRGTARRLGLPVHLVDFKRPPFDYEAGFAEAARARADALFVLGSALWVPARYKIPELALKARLPTVFHHAQCGSRGTDVVWLRLPLDVAQSRRYGGEHSARRQGGRYSHGTADELRTGDQSENRQGARHHNPSVNAAASRPGDRVSR